jgi:hypothetical protein
MKLGPKVAPPKMLSEMLADAWMNGAVPMELRQLTFRSSKWMRPQEYVEQMKAICPDYNEFSIRRMAKILLSPDAKDIQIQPAREYSVCMYVKGEPDVLDWLKLMATTDGRADEASIWADGTLRLWWD